MVRFLLLALALALLHPTARAQERVSSRTEGARALLFQVGSDLSLLSLDGATLSYKRHTSAERALRLGVTAYADTQFMLADGSSGDRQSVTLAATAIPLRYRESAAPMALYVGVGPTALVRFDRIERPTSTESRLAVGGGVAGVVGVEWEVARALGLSAEYGQALTVEYLSNPESLRARLNPQGARLGLSVYF